MHILIVANDAEGLEKFRGMLIEQLSKKRHIVSVILPRSDAEIQIEAEKKLKAMKCHIYHVALERRSMNPIKDLKLFISYRKCLNKLCPEMVVTYTIKPNIYMGVLCEILRIPYVTNITGLGSTFQKDGFVQSLTTLLYKIALVNAKVIFFENRENMEIMIEKGIAKKKNACLLNGAGVDINKFSYLEYPKDDTEIEFLFIGRIMKEKGIDELFYAMEKLVTQGEKCRLTVLGTLEEDYLEKIKKNEKQGWLTYYGSQKDVRPYIKKSHCFVLPSWHEGMANTNLENAASGRPIITSNIHGCMEAVEDGKSGFLVEKKNKNSLYYAMKRFIELPYQEKKEMGVNGRKYMVQNFDKRYVVKETMKHLLYEK